MNIDKWHITAKKSLFSSQRSLATGARSSASINICQATVAKSCPCLLFDMAQALRSEAVEHETFHEFFECWISEQSRHLEELVLASKESERLQEQRHDGDGAVNQQEVDERILRPKITEVIEHYEQYYHVKSGWAKNDVLLMFNQSWRSSLEDSFLWIGGWRPSMAFHLLYSKSGLQLEARLHELRQGLTVNDLGGLSQTQLNQVNGLQRGTIREEKEITEKLAKQQEKVADASMVELSHAVTELIRGGDQPGRIVADERIEATLAAKEEGFTPILKRADDLRLKTLRELINILTPSQGVHFLIAAAELHMRLHEWGKKGDALSLRHHQRTQQL
ncbi:protein DOG1-like 4 [Sesamum angolense]|uniref:Protein DOG1-like 4 n=1 Tax=Sesamum angolense TaxID=2727404 RepID=A0AAE1T621_9LAMI|nr:protein DOG1-like 4 [Sesamum angolense]